MTIAACYLSSEAVVFGADSTTTFLLPSPAGHLPRMRHYNFAQKIFEIGQPSTLGVVIWGLASLPTLSYRTLFAQFADLLHVEPQFADMTTVATRWSEFFWQAYTAGCAPIIQRVQTLAIQSSRTSDEDREFQSATWRVFGGLLLWWQLGALKTT